MSYDYEKVACLSKQKSELQKKMWQEKDLTKRKKLELKIRIIDLKIAIVKL